MKFNIEIDCTAEEARQFLGLPDVQAFQDDIMQQVKQRTADHLKAMDPETMMKTWMPLGIEAVNAMQQAFMSNFGGVNTSKPTPDDD